MERPEHAAINEMLVQNNTFLLAMLGAESRRRFSEALEVLHIGWQAQKVIMFLYASEGSGAVSQRQLADCICVDPRNLVAVVDNLEQQGLLKRAPNPADRRGHQVHITAKGRRVTERLQAICMGIEAEMLASLTAAEKTNLHSLLKKVWDATNVGGEFATMNEVIGQEVGKG